MPTVASMSYARMADATDTSITTRRSFSSSECRKVPDGNFTHSIEKKWTKNGGGPPPDARNSGCAIAGVHENAAKSERPASGRPRGPPRSTCFRLDGLRGAVYENRVFLLFHKGRLVSCVNFRWGVGHEIHEIAVPYFFVPPAIPTGTLASRAYLEPALVPLRPALVPLNSTFCIQGRDLMPHFASKSTHGAQ